MSNRDDLNASPLCGRCKGVAHLKRLHIKTKWYDVMSTTTDGVGSVRPLRTLLIHEGPKDFLARILMSMLTAQDQIIFHMDKNLPDGIKSVAIDRRKFHLNLLAVAKSHVAGRFHVCCRLKDIIFTPANPSGEVLNYFYVGHFDTNTGAGCLDEYSGQDFVSNPIIRSLFGLVELEFFKTL